MTTAYILVILGFAGLLIHSVGQLKRENDALELSRRQQLPALEKGIAAQWKSHLFNYAKTVGFEKRIELRWNRQGTKLRSEYFPSIPAILKWGDYRAYIKDNDLKKAKIFLYEGLERKFSWDRVMAISELSKRFSEKPEVSLAYEKTLIDPEIKAAHQLIFKQFSEGLDFTFATKDLAFGRVFYYVMADGTILAYVPLKRDVAKLVLPSFMQEHNLVSATLGATPWDIDVSFDTEPMPQNSLLDMLLLVFSIVLVLCGGLVYLNSLKDQKRLLLRKVTFLNQLVHELKTPIAGLKIHIQLIQKGLGRAENFSALTTSLNRLDRLFTDLVSINRSQEKVILKKIEPDTLNEILRQLKEEFVELEILSEFDDQIVGDDHRLRVVLRNLISNAIKYGGVAKLRVEKASITVPNQTVERHTYVFIEDCGPGVSRFEASKIFGEFYRGDSVRSSGIDGLGLGLYLSKKMAQEMGANISLKNPGERGAVFCMELKGLEHENNSRR